jgi:hypothetical protein
MERLLPPHDPEFLADLVRFARFFWREEELAEAAVEQALRELQGKPEAGENLRAGLFLYARVARGARKAVPGEGKGSEGLAALRALPFLEGVIAALKVCAPFSEEDAAKVAGCKPAEWKARVGALPSFDRESLRAELAPSESTRAALAAWEEPGRLLRSERRGWLDPMALALGFAFLLLVGWGVWSLLSRADGFPGEEEAVKLLEVASAAGAEDYEPVEVPLGALGDWLALKGVEGFWVPEELETDRTVAARVFTHENVRIAAVALPERQMLVYIFDGAALGIEVRPERHWRFFQQRVNAGAIAQRGRICVMVGIRGSKAELREVLQGGGARS